MEYSKIRKADIKQKVVNLWAKADMVQSNQKKYKDIKNSTRKEAILKLTTILVDYISMM